MREYNPQLTFHSEVQRHGARVHVKLFAGPASGPMRPCGHLDLSAAEYAVFEAGTASLIQGRLKVAA